MSRNDKMKFIRLIEGSNLSISQALARYDVPRSTYYRLEAKAAKNGQQRISRQQARKAENLESVIALAVG